MNAESPSLAGPPESAADPIGPLLDRILVRDESAARELVDRLYGTVAQVVHANLPKRDDPEDLIQEVFLKMFSRLSQFRGEVPFPHWVSRIALNVCFDRLRRQKVRPELRWSDLSEAERIALDETADETQPADADADGALALLDRLLAQLRPEDAWLLRKVELEQKPLAEVCREAGWNNGLTRVRLFRARKRLQQLFRSIENH